MFLIEACCFTFCKLNSSPIDELGEGAHESRWWCHVKYKPQPGCADIDRNPESTNHHQATSHRETQWRYLQTTILANANKEGEKGEGQPGTQRQDLSSKLLHNFPEHVHIIWSLAKTRMFNRGEWARITAPTSIGSILNYYIMKLHLATFNSRRLK